MNTHTIGMYAYIAISHGEKLRQCKSKRYVYVEKKSSYAPFVIDKLVRSFKIK